MRQSIVTLLRGSAQTKNTLNILKQLNAILTLRSCKFHVFCMCGLNWGTPLKKSIDLSLNWSDWGPEGKAPYVGNPLQMSLVKNTDQQRCSAGKWYSYCMFAFKGKTWFLLCLWVEKWNPAPARWWRARRLIRSNSRDTRPSLQYCAMTLDTYQFTRRTYIHTHAQTTQLYRIINYDLVGKSKKRHQIRLKLNALLYCARKLSISECDVGICH